MKIILSRKGFDSQYGQIPSPILPDGTLLSLPIPSKNDMETKFTEIFYNDLSYYDIIYSLNPKTKIKEKYCCHLDPDIRSSVKQREDGWAPSFGQEKAALSHLKNQGVGEGDVFLFFGWFRQTEYVDNNLIYVKGVPDLHIVYGYLQVGEIIDSPKDIPTWLLSHPHAKKEKWEKPNVIYVASPQLSLNPSMPGAACLSYNKERVLTKVGYSKSVWQLPEFFRDIPISYNANSWQGDRFISAAKGQEFVFETNDQVLSWVNSIIQ